MKISRRSWHYRLRCWFDEVGALPNTSLCEYFFILMMILFVGIPFVVPLYYTVIFLYYIAYSIIYCICTIVNYIERIISCFWNKTGIKEPGTLLDMWLKAKKEKVCPMIEWTD